MRLVPLRFAIGVPEEGGYLHAMAKQDGMKNVQPEVVVIGEFFIDEILSGFHVLPKLGEESFARKFHREVGGGAAITACALARLGVRVAVVGAVGKEDGNWVINRLNRYGVDCS